MENKINQQPAASTGSKVIQKILGIVIGIGGLTSSAPFLTFGTLVSGSGVAGSIFALIVFIGYVAAIHYFTKKKFPYFASYFLLTNIGLGLLILIVGIGTNLMTA